MKGRITKMYCILNSQGISFNYDRWLQYFKKNAKHRLNIDFSEETVLDKAIERLIFPSITAFQKGERSEGAYLRFAAKEFAREKNEGAYPEVVDLFIKEENYHSGYLAQYMNRHAIPRQKNSVLDSIFRKLRQVNGIHLEVMILITAEIIALSYYTALNNAVESKALKSICRQMLHDELPHVIFQSYTLSHFKSNVGNRIVRVLLMEFSCLMVWLFYRRVFVAGGYGLTLLLSESLGYLRQSITISQSKENEPPRQ